MYQPYPISVGFAKRAKVRLHTALPLVVVLALCGGCGPVYKVGISSLCSDVAAAKKTYFLFPAMEDVTLNDLQFQEYAAYIDRALQAQGYRKLDPEVADLAILIVYGIGDPETHYYSYSAPVYGQIGGGTSHFDGTAFGSGKTTFFSGSTYTLPEYGVVGSKTHSGSYTTYPRFLLLGAFDAAKLRDSQSENSTELWRTTVVSVGRSSDLRRVMPVMVAAASDYIATHTEQRVDVKLFESNKRVRLIKGLIDSSEQQAKQPLSATPASIKSPQPDESVTCANCGDSIGKLQISFQYEGQTVCVKCYRKLKGLE